MMGNNIIVFGSNHYNTIGVLQCLGIANWHVTLLLVGPKNGLITESKYIGELFTADNYEQGLDILKKHFKFEKPTPIIPCGDEAALLLDKNKEQLRDNNLLFQNSKKYPLEILMNKQKQMDLAQKSGFETPKSFEISVINDIPEGLSFPIIIKPLLSCQGDKRDICIVNSYQELFSEVEILLSHIPKVIIQEYLADKDCELNILGCRKENGECIIPAVLKKLRIHPKERGSVAVCSISPINEKWCQISKLISKLLANMDYCGLFSIEILVRNNHYYFIEANLRNDALNSFVTKRGVNLPHIHGKDLLKENYDVPPIKKGTKKMICEPIHFVALYRGSISFFKWIWDILTSRCFILNMKGDRLLFYKQFIYKLLKR